MKKTVILKKNYEFKNVFEKGKVYCGKKISCFYIKNKNSLNMLGIAIGTKLFNAVKRNRIKRIIRESYRYYEELLEDGNTFVFTWNKKEKDMNCKCEEIKEDMKNIFEKIGILKK